jgi:septal ring factor EnvC (AmiA/AmiB activator)
MAETLLKSDGTEAAGQAEEQGTLSMSADDFSALEERVLRAVEVVRRERQARSEAEARVAQADEHTAEVQAQLGEKGQQVEKLEQDVKQLRAERDHVRERVEKLLKQLDSLEL